MVSMDMNVSVLVDGMVLTVNSTSMNVTGKYLKFLIKKVVFDFISVKHF